LLKTQKHLPKDNRYVSLMRRHSCGLRPIDIWSADETTLSSQKEHHPVKQLVCYCFDYSAEDIRQDVIANGRSLIMEEIRIAKQFGGCQCAVKNPSGR
jgi:hypothetical protein